MTRYKKVDYNRLAWMIRMVCIKSGHDQELLKVVSEVQQRMGLCLDVKRIQECLGNRCVERVEDLPNGVRRVTTWVVVS